RWPGDGAGRRRRDPDEGAAVHRQVGWELAGGGLDAHDPDRHGCGLTGVEVVRVDLDGWDDVDMDPAADVDVPLAGEVEANGALADSPGHAALEHLGAIDVHPVRR